MLTWYAKDLCITNGQVVWLIVAGKFILRYGDISGKKKSIKSMINAIKYKYM